MGRNMRNKRRKMKEKKIRMNRSISRRTKKERKKQAILELVLAGFDGGDYYKNVVVPMYKHKKYYERYKDTDNTPPSLLEYLSKKQHHEIIQIHNQFVGSISKDSKIGGLK